MGERRSIGICCYWVGRMEEYRDLLLLGWEDGGVSGSAVIGLVGWRSIGSAVIGLGGKRSIGICCYWVGRKEEYRDLLLLGWEDGGVSGSAVIGLVGWRSIGSAVIGLGGKRSIGICCYWVGRMEEYRDLLLLGWEDGGESGSAVISLGGRSIGICCYRVGRMEEYQDLLLSGWEDGGISDLLLSGWEEGGVSGSAVIGLGGRRSIGICCYRAGRKDKVLV